MIAKLAADTLIFELVHLLAFFIYMGLASRKKLVQIKEDFKTDFLTASIMTRMKNLLGNKWDLMHSLTKFLSMVAS